MKKLRLSGISLLLLAFVLFMTACGAQETAAPQGIQGHVTATQQVQDDTNASQDVDAEATLNADAEASQGTDAEAPQENAANDKLPIYGEYYYDLTNVVLYLEAYGELPANYITKAEARELGWEGGSVEKYMEGAAIGGDSFGNREGLLPEAQGRYYTECDIDTNGYGSRGSRRLVFSNDGLYFYTSDHYESFSEVIVTKDYEVIR